MRATDLQAQAEDTSVTTAVEPPLVGTRYTSIVYFHGMGTPRRYEELSRVLDTLDRHAQAQKDPSGIGVLRGQKVRLEGPRAGGEEPVAFIEFYRLLDLPRVGPRRTDYFRLYESFWSPAAAGGVSPWQVLRWVLRRTLTPLTVLFSPWRAHQRLKRTYLNRLYFDSRSTPVRHFRTLAGLYQSFEAMPARRRFPSGWFDEFLLHIEDNHLDPNEHARLREIAFRWWEALVASQLSVLLTAAMIVGLLFGLLTLVLGAGAQALDWAGLAADWMAPVLTRGASLPGWMAMATCVLVPVLGYYGGSFLRNFLSDVVFWTTTFEKDIRYQKRRDILQASEATLRHVLCDPLCDRVVVVAHSLGTAIAYETLLNLGRKATAERLDAGRFGSPDRPVEPLLSKLSHFVTFGSPIDRIFYFFNLTFSRYHRFNKVVDDLLGGTDDPPFRIRKTRNLQWINIRDAADPVASRLFSPRSKPSHRDTISEVEVASTHVPNPVGAHVGYFDAALSAKVLFDACILDRKQVQAQQQRSRLSRLFAAQARAASLVLAGSAVVFMVVGATGFWLRNPAVASYAQVGFLVALILLSLLGIAGWLLDRRERLTLST